MATFSASVLTGAGTATLPMCALVGGTGAVLVIREIGIFNTTTTATDVQLCRVSTAGTPGSSATTLAETPTGTTPVGVLKGTYTSTAPTTSIVGRRAALGAAAGSGIVWTFPDGLWVPATSAAALGIISGTTGQACDVYFVWNED